MKGKIQKLDGVFPVTVGKAVYIGDGTSKTILDYIKDKDDLTEQEIKEYYSGNLYIGDKTYNGTQDVTVPVYNGEIEENQIYSFVTLNNYSSVSINDDYQENIENSYSKNTNIDYSDSYSNDYQENKENTYSDSSEFKYSITT